MSDDVAAGVAGTTDAGREVTVWWGRCVGPRHAWHGPPRWSRWAAKADWLRHRLTCRRPQWWTADCNVCDWHSRNCRTEGAAIRLGRRHSTAHAASSSTAPAPTKQEPQ